ncbi:MAG: ABC transporter ATP-binding protein [Roseobacter sp.]
MSFEIANFTIGYKRQTILRDVNLSLASGQITGLIGPNGVGKSSLLKGIAGIAKSEGSIKDDGAILSDTHRRKIISYMPQDSSGASSLTLTEVVLMGRLTHLGLRVDPALIHGVHVLLAEFGLAHLADRTLEAVSGGQRQLCYLAQSMFREPQVLLLDEPTAALDLRHQLVVFEALRKLAQNKQIAVVVALHDLSLAGQFCDQIACLSGGRLDAIGAPRDVLTAARIGRVYGIKAEVEHKENQTVRVTALQAIG